MNGIQSRQLWKTDGELLEAQQKHNEELRKMNEELQSENARLIALNGKMQENLKFIDDTLPKELPLSNIKATITSAKEDARVANKNIFRLGEKQKEDANRAEAKLNEAQEKFEESLTERAECLRVAKEDEMTLQESLARVEEKQRGTNFFLKKGRTIMYRNASRTSKLP